MPNIITVVPVSVGTLVAANSTLLYILAILYFLTTLYALRRLPLLPPSRGRAPSSSPRLLVALVAFSSAVRAASIAVCTLLALDSRLRDRLTPAQWNLTVQLLFNAGDWQTVCCYALLMLVWLEMLQRTRAHVYDPRRITRDWRSVLCVVAALVQVAQVALYASAFETAPAVSLQLLSAIYLTLAAFNIALPLLLVVGWGLAGCLYAGFPFRTRAAERAWRRFTPLVLFWTLGRGLWSLGTLSLTNSAMLQALSTTQWSWLFPLAMLTLFVLAELVPFLATLGTGVLHALRSQLVGGGRGSGGSGGWVREGGEGGEGSAGGAGARPMGRALMEGEEEEG